MTMSKEPGRVRFLFAKVSLVLAVCSATCTFWFINYLGYTHKLSIIAAGFTLMFFCLMFLLLG